MSTSTPTLPSTNPNNANTTEGDFWSGPVRTSAQPLHASQQDADADRQARLDMVECARIQGEAQAKRPQLPNMDRNIFDMVPGEYRGSIAQARAYLDAMVGRADGGNRPRHLDSRDVGALPIDGAILSDARSPVGFPRAISELTPDCTVNYMGTRMSVEEAVRQGLLEVDANGRYSVPNAEARQAQQREQEQQQNAQAAAELQAKQATGDEPDSDAIAAIDRVNQVVPANVTQAFIKDVIDNGSISLANVHAVARQYNIPTAHAEAMTKNAWDGLTRQARTVALNAGIPEGEVQDAWNHMHASDPVEAAMSMRAFINGDTSGLRRALAAYKARNNGRG
ncbi:MAG: hypothetical protein AB7U95_25110 [Reyranella sp.]